MMQQETGERGTLAKNRAVADGAVKQMQHGLDAGVDADGKTPLSAERRAKITAFVTDLRLYAQEMDRVRISPPTLTVEDELVIHRGDREIHILHPGLGNTDSDMVVWLPKEGVLVTGDLLPNPIPYGFGSFPKEWIATLDRLAALHPRTLIPGHGDIQHDLGYLHQVQALLGTVIQQVGAVAKRGGSLEEARSALDLGDLAKPFTDTPRKKALFQEWFITPITDMAYREALGRPIIQGES
jgi:glyoxylase-like metal-dependent hydrolase (beta-lactamase superfamily II)